MWSDNLVRRSRGGPGGGATVLKNGLHTLLFLIGLLGTAAGIHALDDMPFWGWNRGKMLQVTQGLDEYDTIFVGSSRVEHGVVPEVFDRRMAQLGHPSSSYNLAFGGVRANDVAAYADWVLERRPKRLRRLVIELQTYDQWRGAGDNWMADQDLEMHTVASLRARLESIWLSPRRWRQQLAMLHFVLAHAVTNVLCIGQAPRIVDGMLGLDRYMRKGEADWVRDRGFVTSAVVAGPDLRRIHEEFAADPSQGRDRLDWKWRPEVVAARHGGFPLRVLRAQADRIRAMGIEPIYVVMPCCYADFLGADAIPQVAAEFRVLDLDRPDLYPELFAFDLWHDPGHFDLGGALLFSEYLAEGIVGSPDTAPRASELHLMGTRLPVDRATLRFAATGVPADGELIVLVAESLVRQELGNGVVLDVPLAAPVTIPLTRLGRGIAEGEGTIGGLPSDRVLYAQLCVHRSGGVIATSPRVHVDPDPKAMPSKPIATMVSPATSVPRPVGSPAPPAAVPVAPTLSRPTLRGVSSSATPHRVEFTASNLPERGDVLLLVGTAPATQELRGGLVLRVALPVAWWGPMARTGAGAATVGVDLPGLAKDQVLHAQLCVVENGVVTGASVGVRVEPPR